VDFLLVLLEFFLTIHVTAEFLPAKREATTDGFYHAYYNNLIYFNTKYEAQSNAIFKNPNCCTISNLLTFNGNKMIAQILL